MHLIRVNYIQNTLREGWGVAKNFGHFVKKIQNTSNQEGMRNKQKQCIGLDVMKGESTHFNKNNLEKSNFIRS